MPMLKKSPFNLLKIIFLAGFLLSGSLSFAQNEAVDNKDPSAPEAVEDHNTKDLEALLKRYNTDSEKVLDDSSKIHNIEAGTAASEVKDSDLEEMRPVDALDKGRESSWQKMKKDREEKIKKAAVAGSELSQSVRLALEPLQSLSEGELLKRFQEASKNSPARHYFEKFPKIPVFAVRLIKDEESIPSLVKIVEDKGRLIYFGSSLLISILFGFFLKKIMHREGRSFIEACFYFLIRLHIMFAVRIAIIYYFYSVEFTPAAKVFKETFL